MQSCGELGQADPLDLHQFINIRYLPQLPLYTPEQFFQPCCIYIHISQKVSQENPLKKMQSVVAVACKIIRVFYTILTKGVGYDANKLMGDIRRPQIQTA